MTGRVQRAYGFVCMLNNHSQNPSTMEEASRTGILKYIQLCKSIGTDCLHMVLDHQTHIDLKMINLGDRLVTLKLDKKKIFALLVSQMTQGQVRSIVSLQKTRKPQAVDEEAAVEQHRNESRKKLSVISQNNVSTKLTLMVDQLAAIQSHLQPLQKRLEGILTATSGSLYSPSLDSEPNISDLEVDLYDQTLALQKDPTWLDEPIGIALAELMSLGYSLECCFQTAIEVGAYFREAPRGDPKKEVDSTDSQITKRSALSESLAVYKQKKEQAEHDRKHMKMTYSRSRREIQSDFVLMRREEKRLKPKDKRWGCCI